MARQIMDQILAEARAIIADRRRRLRCTEAVTAQGDMCDACLPTAVRFCAVGPSSTRRFGSPAITSRLIGSAGRSPA